MRLVQLAGDGEVQRPIGREEPIVNVTGVVQRGVSFGPFHRAVHSLVGHLSDR